MAQVSMTVRMDSAIKAQFDALCSQFGMSANTAMNIFVNTVVQRKAIPFTIKIVKENNTPEDEGITAYRKIRQLAEDGQLPDLSLDEINEEIRLAREERVGR